MNNFVAAWPSKASQDTLNLLGVTKQVHLTTFFDRSGRLEQVAPYAWAGPQTATIARVVEWRPGLVVAEMADCAWSQEANDHYTRQVLHADLPHKAHVTLAKRVAPGTAATLQHLVGVVLTFDRHGFEEVAPCGACLGSGWVPRDPDIGTEQECPSCGGAS